MARARTVSAPRDASVIAGVAIQEGSVAAAARALGVSRGALDGILGGRHGMGDKVHAAVESYLRNLPPSESKFVKDIGRTAAYAAGSSTSGGATPGARLRAQTQRLKSYDKTNQRKEVSFFVRRVNEVSGKQRSSGAGASGVTTGPAGGQAAEDSDAEWYAEYGAWVEEVDAWTPDDREYPDLEELPF